MERSSLSDVHFLVDFEFVSWPAAEQQHEHCGIHEHVQNGSENSKLKLIFFRVAQIGYLVLYLKRSVDLFNPCVYWRVSVDFLLKTGIFIPKVTTYRSKENTTFLFV